MPKREIKETTRRHLWIYDADWDRLNTYFGQTIGISKAVRGIVHNYLNSLESQAAAVGKAKHPVLSTEDVDRIERGSLP